MCSKTSQSLGHPCFSQQLVPFAATVLHHSRLAPLDLSYRITRTKSVRVIPALSRFLRRRKVAEGYQVHHGFAIDAALADRLGRQVVV
jgi:hypothetical protein